jgi:hypothetical protein
VLKHENEYFLRDVFSFVGIMSIRQRPAINPRMPFADEPLECALVSGSRLIDERIYLDRLKFQFSLTCDSSY